MSTAVHYEWEGFYAEFAQALLQYKDNRAELIEKVKKIYDTTGFKMPALEKDNHIEDIDPFTIFGMFNKKLTDANRIAILSAIAQIFDVSTPVPHNFDSLPVLNPLNANFYLFLPDRQETDIDDLWGLYENALAYAKAATKENRSRISKYFDAAVNIKFNGNGKVTMGLYWIAPDAFLNLDQRNTWYIYESGKIPADVVAKLPTIEPKIPAEKYFDIMEILRGYLQSRDSSINGFKELSYEAWRYSEEINQQKEAQKKALQGGKSPALADEDVETVRYWLISPGENASIWDECCSKGIIAFGWDKLGDLSTYASKSDLRQALKDQYDPNRTYSHTAYAAWQFVHDIKPGDVVFAKRGVNTVVGRGVVMSGYEFDNTREHYKNVRKVNWTDRGEWPHPGTATRETLTDITPYSDYVGQMNALFVKDDDEGLEEQELTYPEYGEEKFLQDVFMDEESYHTLVDLVRGKKNVILQGAPGVGKTYAAKRLAYSMMGVKDPSRVMMVQFHQSYSYEDFIMGFRPSEQGFVLKHGTFYNFCKAAEIDSDNEYFFIIDEINRGNLSKIFGELFMLIEGDKRGVELQLLYADEKFCIPQNVYIIGMMNTADRSLAMMDFALRRRFGFYDMKPGFESDQFRAYRMELGSQKLDKLIACVESLNGAITADDSLGEGFRIGHSFFCNLEEVTDRALHSIVEYELIPLLKEYWFDEPTKVKDWASNLRSAIK